jgi:hypothetical protein
MAATDPALDLAARVLPDPSSLTATELRALDLARRFRLVEIRGGFRAGDAKVSAITAKKLEARGLVRRLIERNRYTILCTGAGKMLLDIVSERKARKGKA